MKQLPYYLVGGAVRDSILGIKCKDYDYAVEASSFEEMEEWIVANGGTIFLSKPEFFTSRAKVPGHVEAADYVLCRKDGDYRDGRRPDSVIIGTLYDDLQRRDFTVNAMAICQLTGELIDPFGGQKALEQMRLSCVGDVYDRFGEDYLRILRAMRFVITKGFVLDEEIDSYLRGWENVENLPSVSKERVYEELRKCFDHNTWKTLEFLQDYDQLRDVIFNPEDGCGLNLSPRI